MRSLLAISLLTALAACQGEKAPSEAPATAGATSAPTASTDTPSPMVSPVDARPNIEPQEDNCGAGKLDRWLNVLPTDTVKAEIVKAVGERVIRYYGPSDALTMDFSEERLNAELGEDGRIKRFHCG